MLLTVGCGGGNDEVAETAATAPAAATAERGAAVAPAAATALVSPTPYGGSVPPPIVVRPSATPAAAPATVAPAAEVVISPTPTAPAMTPTPSGGVPRSSGAVVGDADCGDFLSHREAQLFFLENGGPIDDHYGLDTDKDGIACNAAGDSGYERIAFALFGAPTATPEATVTATVPKRSCDDFATWQEAYDFFISEGGPRSDPHNMDGDRDGVPCTTMKNLEENPPTPTPTFPPAEAAAGVWSSEARTAELNSIDWAAFRTIHTVTRLVYNNGVIRIVPAGETINTRWSGEGSPSDGMSIESIDMDCAPRFGNRIDKLNPTYAEWSYGGKAAASRSVWLWIEPADGSGAFCVKVDLYRNWLPTDPTPLPKIERENALPRGDKADPLVFTDPVNGPRFHTMPPLDFLSLDRKDLGRILKIIEGELECVPEQLPVAIWTRQMGFETLGRDEEELLARYFFPNLFDEPREPDELWQAYDWEKKEFWRNAGWFLAITNNPYDPIPPWVRCWFVRNTADLPPPRYCLECERRENMDRLAEQKR